MIITKDFRTWNINDTSNMSSFNIHTSHAMDGHKQGSFLKPWEAYWKMKAENVGLINVNHEKGKLIYNWKSNYKIYGKSRYYSPSNHLFFNYCFKKNFFSCICFLINYEVFSVFLMHFSHPFKFASNVKADNFSSFSREQKWQEVIITHWLYPVLQTPYLKLHVLNLT